MAKYCHAAVQKLITATINDDTYRVQLLTLTEQAWDSISDDSDHSASENRRMEWVGDGIIAWRISFKLYETFSQGDVEFYNAARSCLVSNLTLTHLMQKIAAAAAIPCFLNKTSADVFETLVGALYVEYAKSHLEYKFYAWFDDIFVPLSKAADTAYRSHKRKLKMNKTRRTRFKMNRRLGHKAGLVILAKHFTFNSLSTQFSRH
ncbi:hypothetical protein C8R45DRAFT_616970 [Mycena sanguinolenta]|nr:hypothetical protein C8R45DRAFT_616970 [Mycena sanguinolenta]